MEDGQQLKVLEVKLREHDQYISKLLDEQNNLRKDAYEAEKAHL